MTFVTPRPLPPAPSGPGGFELWVPPVPEGASRVRRALTDLQLPEALLEDARLLATELIVNSIRHAGLREDERVRVRAEWSGSRLRVDVWDRPGSTAHPRVAGSIRPPAGAESGWGLYLVDRLASRWGSTPGRYWFELELRNGTDKD